MSSALSESPSFLQGSDTPSRECASCFGFPRLCRWTLGWLLPLEHDDPAAAIWAHGHFFTSLLLILWDIYPKVPLLEHMAILFSVSEASPSCFLKGLPRFAPRFLHILANACSSLF